MQKGDEQDFKNNQIDAIIAISQTFENVPDTTKAQKRKLKLKTKKSL